MRFKQQYNKEFRPKLAEKLKLVNIHSVPVIKKVVVNVGVGEAATNKKVLEKVVEDLTLISGQKPVVTKARKSVSAFKIRKGLPIGVKVTLRNQAMFDFLEKLIKIVLPRIRDFRGISGANIDARGNLNLGIREQTLFPEIDYDRIDKIRGLEVTIVTNARNKDAGRALFEIIGIPFTG